MNTDYIAEAVEITDAIVDVLDAGGNKSQITDTIAKLLERQQKLQQRNVSGAVELIVQEQKRIAAAKPRDSNSDEAIQWNKQIDRLNNALSVISELYATCR